MSVDSALEKLSKGDINPAVEELKKCASVNNVVAQFYLGQCYEHGIGMEINQQQAFLMYRRAAERGFGPAMQSLANCYSDGIGVSVNPDKAKEWTARYMKRGSGTDYYDILAIYTSIQDKIYENKSLLIATSVDSQGKEKQSSLNSESEQESHKLKNIPVHQNRPQNTSSSSNISDIDIDIPKCEIEKANVFALIIANENYQDAASVPDALNDGEVFAKYLQYTLGLPISNIHIVKDATLNNIKREINLISKIAEAYKGDASFIVYYAGHGIPDESTRDAHLLPIDGYPSDITTCYRLSDLYTTLGKMPSAKTIVMIDACFSGASRSGNMLTSARGVAIKSKAATPSGNMIVLSSATGDETAYPYKGKNHGMFTYFLLKKIKETRGNITIGSLMEYVIDNVVKSSIVLNGKSQTPTVIPSNAMYNKWENLTLN